MSTDLDANKREKSVIDSVCESCGNEFSCGANTGNCWCFDVKLSPQTLIEIESKYSKCLCPACLADTEREFFPARKN